MSGKCGGLVWAGLLALFLACAVLLNLIGEVEEKPYSSYNTGDDGAAAAYLLLEELGFRVERKTGPRWSGEGTLIALGADYLPDAGDALTRPDDRRFLNGSIADNAVEFVEWLWPYRDAPIVFEEYGRAMTPISAGEPEERTLSSITPMWLKICLASALLGAFLMLFFCGQRLGRPLPPEDFAGRPPLEGVYAVAGAWRQIGVYRDCAAYYYNYRTRNGDQWDRGHLLGDQLGGLADERQALRLVAETDRTIKEYRNEGKRRFDRAAR